MERHLRPRPVICRHDRALGSNFAGPDHAAGCRRSVKTLPPDPRAVGSGELSWSPAERPAGAPPAGPCRVIGWSACELWGGLRKYQLAQI
jgi:hypothetical protein